MIINSIAFLIVYVQLSGSVLVRMFHKCGVLFGHVVAGDGDELVGKPEQGKRDERTR